MAMHRAREHCGTRRPVAWLAGALLTAPPALGAGSYDVCREPAPESMFRAAYALYDDVSLRGAELGRDNWAADLRFRRANDWLLGGSYRGTLLDERDAGFRTNGYLHGFYFELHRLRSADRRLRWAVAPALSGSSNVTKDPDEYDGEAWQLLLAAVWEWPAGEELAFRAGLCADHRFGAYRAYPVLGMSWRPTARWAIDAGFPDTTVSYRPAAALEAALALHPNGNEWYVKDKSLEFASMFEYRAWSAELSLTWHASPAVAWSAGAGVDFATEYRGELADGSRPRLDAGTVPHFSIDVRWFF